MDNSIVKGSLGQIARDKNLSIAETFIGSDGIIIMDESGSMMEEDCEDSETKRKISRFDKGNQELRALQSKVPGKIALIGFSSAVFFRPNGKADLQGAGTDMLKALEFVKPADMIDGMKFWLISDGEPDFWEMDSIIEAAKKFKNKINTIYVGDPEQTGGPDFLRRLAAATGGVFEDKPHMESLGEGIAGLLGG